MIELTVRLHDEGEVTGVDTMIAAAPEWVNEKVLLAKQLAQYLHGMSIEGAASLGEMLHHADWVVTDDSDLVRKTGLRHPCTTCMAGVDQALAFMRENPDRQIMVGTLFYA